MCSVKGPSSTNSLCACMASLTSSAFPISYKFTEVGSSTSRPCHLYSSQQCKDYQTWVRQRSRLKQVTHAHLSTAWPIHLSPNRRPRGRKYTIEFENRICEFKIGNEFFVQMNLQFQNLFLKLFNLLICDLSIFCTVTVKLLPLCLTLSLPKELSGRMCPAHSISDIRLIFYW